MRDKVMGYGVRVRGKLQGHIGYGIGVEMIYKDIFTFLSVYTTILHCKRFR